LNFLNKFLAKIFNTKLGNISGVFDLLYYLLVKFKIIFQTKSIIVTQSIRSSPILATNLEQIFITMSYGGRFIIDVSCTLIPND